MNNNDYKTADFDNMPGFSKSVIKPKDLSNTVKITSTYPSKEIDLELAKKFSEKLIDIYNNKKIPIYI